MNKILIIILIISLFFIEGCTVIGHNLGKGIQTKQSLEKEKIETIEEKSRLTITLKNNEVIKGQFISCVDETISVTFNTNTYLNTPISNNQFLSISNNKSFYKIPLDQINDIKIIKSDFRVAGMLLGIVVDLFAFLMILMILNPPSTPSGNFLG